MHPDSSDVSAPEARPAPRAERFPLLHPAVILFALLPFQWIVVGSVAGFTLKLPYLAVLAALPAALLVPRARGAALALAARHAHVLLPYLFYLLILLVALWGSKAQGMPIRQVFFIAGFVGVAAWLNAASDIGGVARRGGALAILCFLVATEVMARGIGLSWWTAVSRFVTAGDLNFVVYGFFRAIFNAPETGGEPAIAASAKNALAVVLLVALQMFRAGRAPGRTDWAGMLLTALVFFVLLMLNTRSVLVVAILGLPLVALLSALRAAHHNPAALVLKATAAVLLATGAAMLATSGTALVDAVGGRFTFDDSSTGARFEQYAWAVERIERNFLTGSGYAEIDGQPVHNLFLGAFMHAGLAAFLLVLVFYAGLFLAWLGFMARIVVQPGAWVLPMRAEWVALLPTVPLFRMWIAGDAGHPALAEWIALGCFCGLVLANRRQAAQRGEPSGDAAPRRRDPIATPA